MKKNYKLIAVVLFIIGAAYLLFAKDNTVIKFKKIPTEAFDDTLIEIDLTKEHRENYDFGDAFEIIDIIPLKRTQRESRLTKVDKIVSYGSKYIISDPELKAITVFDKTGDYHQRIGAFGEDSSQYLDITDFLFDQTDRSIKVYSSASRGILTYDINGKFRSYVEVPFFGYKFAKQSSGFLFFMNNNFNEESGYNNIVQVNNFGKVTGKAFHTTSTLRPAISFSGALTGSDDDILSSMPFNDTIFKITNQGYYPKYVFNFGHCAFRNFETVPLDRLNAEMMNHCFLEDGFIEKENILSFSFSDLKRRKTLLGYHFKDRNITITSDMFIEKSLIWFLSRPKLIEGDNIYSIFNTQLFSAQPDRKKIVKNIYNYSPKLAAVLDTLNIRSEHNPILVCYRKRRLQN